MNFSTCTSEGYALAMGRVEEIVAFISIFCCWFCKCTWYSAMCLLNSEENQADLHLLFYLSPPCSHFIHIPQRRVKGSRSCCENNCWNWIMLRNLRLCEFKCTTLGMSCGIWFLGHQLPPSGMKSSLLGSRSNIQKYKSPSPFLFLS